jgi:hypothetical protein
MVLRLCEDRPLKRSNRCRCKSRLSCRSSIRFHFTISQSPSKFECASFILSRLSSVPLSPPSAAYQVACKESAVSGFASAVLHRRPPPGARTAKLSLGSGHWHQRTPAYGIASHLLESHEPRLWTAFVALSVDRSQNGWNAAIPHSGDRPQLGDLCSLHGSLPGAAPIICAPQ